MDIFILAQFPDGRTANLGQELMTDGWHPPRKSGNPRVALAIATARYMADCYLRWKSDRTFWVAVTKGWTVEYIKIDMSDSFDLLWKCATPDGQEYAQRTIVNVWEIEQAVKAMDSRDHSILAVTSLDGRQNEVNQILKRVFVLLVINKEYGPVIVQE